MAKDDLYTELSRLRTLTSNDDIPTVVTVLRVLAMHCTSMAYQTRQHPDDASDASDAVAVMGLYYDMMAEVYDRVVAQFNQEDKDGPP